MKTDAEVLLMKRERAKGRTQEQAAARAGMGVRTVRRYERAGKLPRRASWQGRELRRRCRGSARRSRSDRSWLWPGLTGGMRRAPGS